MKTFKSNKKWEQLFQDENFITKINNESLPDYVKNCRWFAAKGIRIKQFRIESHYKMRSTEGLVYLLIFEAVFQAGNSESYLIPIHFSNTRPIKEALIQKINLKDQQGYLMDALYLESFRNSLLKHIIKKSRLNYPDAELFFEKGKIFSRDKTLKRIESRMLSAEQSNTTIVYNNKYFLKMYRRLFLDLNPDYELTHFLTVLWYHFGPDAAKST